MLNIVQHRVMVGALLTLLTLTATVEVDEHIGDL